MEPPGFTLIAHRGYSADAPENTLAAFDLAIARGFLHIETDVQLTSDGVPVLFHDKELDRHTNGQGYLAETSYQELLQLDAGSWFGPQFSGQQVPTLADFLARHLNDDGQTGIHLHLELKSQQPRLADCVAEALQRSGWLHAAAAQCSSSGADGSAFSTPGLTLTSFHFAQLERSRQLLPTVRHGWLVREMTVEAVQQAVDAGVRGLYPMAGNVDGVAVRQALGAGRSVRGWGVKTEQDLLRLVGSGAQGCTVDWPSRADKALQAKQAALN